MPISELLNRPCTLLQRTASGEKDKYGNAKTATTEVDTVCEVQQAQRSELNPEGQISDTVWNGYFPVGTELDTGDAVRVEGIGHFELTGEPWVVRDPEEGLDDHLEATLRRVAGAEEAS